MEQSECSETLAYKIQTPGNYPEESIQHSEYDKSLKSRINLKMLKLQIAYRQVYVHIAVTTAHSDEPPLIKYHSRFFFLSCAHKHPYECKMQRDLVQLKRAMYSVLLINSQMMASWC